MLSKRSILFLIPVVFVCAVWGVSSAQEPGRLAFNLNDRPDHEIRLFVFDDFTILESHYSSGEGEKKYQSEVLPALTEEQERTLRCVHEPVGHVEAGSCGDIADVGPDFSTCSEDCPGAGCPSSCVEVWDLGSFYLIANYDRAGVPALSAEDKD
jgi:hypothetical protein